MAAEPRDEQPDPQQPEVAVPTKGAEVDKEPAGHRVDRRPAHQCDAARPMLISAESRSTRGTGPHVADETQFNNEGATSMNNCHGSATVSLPSDCEIVITRVFDAPAALVFEAATAT